MRSGDKHARVLIDNDNAALDSLCYLALDSLARILYRLELLKTELCVNALFRERRRSYGIVDLDNNSVDNVAYLYNVLHLGGGVVGKLLADYVACLLCADLNDCFLLGNAYYRSFNSFAVI